MPDTATTRAQAARIRRSLRRRARVRLDRYADRLGYRRAALADEGAGDGPTGMVEVFDERHAEGWIRADKADFPLRVSLYVNDTVVANTWADEPVKRHSAATVRGFAIAVKDIWTYTRPEDKITVRVGDRKLMIGGHGMYRRPVADGGSTLADLAARQEQGYLFGQDGRLQLSKKLDLQWQADVAGLYHRMSSIIYDAHGYEPFVIYGTLLGIVREGGYIGHDLDFDSAYLSRHTHGPDVAAEMRDMCLTLIAAGYDVELKRTVLHVHDPADHQLRIDLFHFWFDENDELATAFGVAGTSVVPRSAWAGVEDVELGEHTLRKPVNAEAIVEHIYGPSWRTPIAGWSWRRSRTKRSDAGVVPWEYMEEIHWANFYARHSFDTPSDFCRSLVARDDLPATVVDIGCGEGRDSRAFAAAGRTVTGLDRSTVGIANATQAAADAGVADSTSFVTVDVTDAAALRATLDGAIGAAGDAPVLFYLRFFLHAVRADVQVALLATLSELARDGDLFAAEFRTERDETNLKFYGRHYRRFQKAAEFRRDLETAGFTVVEDEQARGLSVLGRENPHLYRVLARRSRS